MDVGPTGDLPEHIKRRGTLYLLSAQGHMARSRELLADAATEPDGEKKMMLMWAAQRHVRHAEYLEGKEKDDGN